MNIKCFLIVLLTVTWAGVAQNYVVIASPQTSPTVALGAAGSNTNGSILVSFAYDGSPTASYTSDIWDGGSPITVTANQKINLSNIGVSTQLGVTVTGKILCATKVGFDPNNPVFYNVGTIGPSDTTATIDQPDSNKVTVCPTVTGHAIQALGYGFWLDEFGQIVTGCLDGTCASTAYANGALYNYNAGVSPGGGNASGSSEPVSGGYRISNPVDIRERVPTGNGSLVCIHAPNDTGGQFGTCIRTLNWPAGHNGRIDTFLPLYSVGGIFVESVGFLGNQDADRSAPMVPITMFTPLVTGQFELAFELQGNSTCTTPGPAAVTFSLTYTDKLSTKTLSALPMTVNGSVTPSASFPIGIGPNNAASGSYNFRAVAGTDIQLSTGYIACTAGTGTYRVGAVLKQTSP